MNSILILSFFIAGALPQLATQAKDDPMKLKPRTNTRVVLADKGTSSKIAMAKGKPGAITPQLALLGAEAIDINGKPHHWVSFTIKNWNQFRSTLFQPTPGLPPCGENTKSARAWLAIYNSDTNAYIYGYCAMSSSADLKDFGYAIPKSQSPPKQVYVVLTDRETNTVYQSNCINAWSGSACAKP